MRFIAEGNTTIDAFGFVVLFNRGRSLVVALSPTLTSVSIAVTTDAPWQLKMSDYPLVAPRVYIVTSMAGIEFKLASLDHAVESTVGLSTLNAICRP